jgi:hypothetical protein
VRRGSVGCGVDQLGSGVAQQGVAWLDMVRRGSVRERRGSAGCCVARKGAAWLS